MSNQTKPGSRRGFSLIELLFAMTITLGIGLVVFQLFIQNERVFRDQSLILEMQQSTRAVASMIADDLRKAGQGVPIYSATQDATVNEAAQAFLDGTDASTIRFRAAVRNAMSTVSTPLSYTVNSSTTMTVGDVSAINAIVQSNTGRFVYLWGPSPSSWTWVRSEITTIQPGSSSITATPRQISGQGGVFSGSPTIVLEEGISYRLNGDDVLRGTTTTFTNLTAPTFTESTVGENFTNLAFTYYNEAGATVDPTTLALRSTIRRVDFTIAAQTSDTLSNGAVRTYPVTLTVYPRNLEID